MADAVALTVVTVCVDPGRTICSTWPDVTCVDVGDVSSASVS
jgi:hypothetical protein